MKLRRPISQTAFLLWMTCLPTHAAEPQQSEQTKTERGSRWALVIVTDESSPSESKSTVAERAQGIHTQLLRQGFAESRIFVLVDDATFRSPWPPVNEYNIVWSIGRIVDGHFQTTITIPHGLVNNPWEQQRLIVKANVNDGYRDAWGAFVTNRVASSADSEVPVEPDGSIRTVSQ
jgi:hypothetical protein